MFYEFDQNNSGGHFVTNDTLCHRLFIEADSANEAISKAEELGCYWNGVDDGLDCPCCGDRWSCGYLPPVDIERYATEGWAPREFSLGKWYQKYGDYEIIKKPVAEKHGSFTSYVGNIRLRTIEEYAQYLANEYGWTTPDARIFYADGTVREIFTRRAQA